MQTSPSKTSIFGLIVDLKDETKTFIKEEVQLAKAEISENISHMGRNAVGLAIGGFVAYAGLIVFLAGLGLLIGFAFEKLGLQPALAAFIGFAIIGLVVAGIGYAFIAEALKSFSHSSMKPEKTIETLKDLKGSEPEYEQFEDSDSDDEPKRSSKEIHASVVAHESAMGETMDEISRRLSPRYASEQFKAKFRDHPYRWNCVAMLTGLAGGFFVKRKITSRS